ncbi:hypothetical protein BJ508DRAFT_409967 [Ascobolus immersus RN42]|uniref:Uncharacterized protein n=1 Tax=Ascobolus immersus RN42 TaxID=1160509 RepID=A0A3N4IQ57_ASCIM|nr:hypothetical protein BJ508DRAFT_409967 [Ascobolus immersus RN42]
MSDNTDNTLQPQAPPQGPTQAQILAKMPALLGGYPSTTLDLPLSAVLIAIFASLAATNVTLFIRNKKRGLFFPLNMVTFGFCMARITTFTLRIVWSKHIFHRDVSTVAQIMVAAGVVLLYIVNMVLTKRLLDSRHPRVGRNIGVRVLFKLYYASLIVILALVIKAVVYRFGGKTLSSSDKTVMKLGPIWFTVFAFLPLPLSTLIALTRSTRTTPLGTPADRATKWQKVALICAASFFLTLGASIRAGINFLPARLNSNPAWYHHRAVFYVFLPVVEICAVLVFVAGRMDRKFYVPKTVVETKEGESMESLQEKEGVREGGRESDSV